MKLTWTYIRSLFIKRKISYVLMEWRNEFLPHCRLRPLPTYYFGYSGFLTCHSPRLYWRIWWWTNISLIVCFWNVFSFTLFSSLLMSCLNKLDLVFLLYIILHITLYCWKDCIVSLENKGFVVRGSRAPSDHE